MSSAHKRENKDRSIAGWVWLALKRAWHYWMAFGRVLGDVVGRVLLVGLYFTLFAPFGLIARITTRQLGLAKPGQTSFWFPRRVPLLTARDLRRQ